MNTICTFVDSTHGICGSNATRFFVIEYVSWNGMYDHNFNNIGCWCELHAKHIMTNYTYQFKEITEEEAICSEVMKS